jgi:branched-chain amino acid transport system ATP-binding protein
MVTVAEPRTGLVARGLSVRFGGVNALEDVDLEVARTEIVGLVGPNGAGKSTVINCLGGQLTPASGSVTLDGVHLDAMAPFRRARLGVARTFQRIEVFPELSVRQHLFVALRARRPQGARWSELVDRGRPNHDEAVQIDQTLALVGLVERGDVAVGRLPLGECRLVELGRALVGRPSVVLADEPTSGLDGRESQMVATVLRSLPAQGTGVLLVEHDLRTVEAVSDRVVVLHVGRVIAHGSFASVMADPVVQEAYLGRVA